MTNFRFKKGEVQLSIPDNAESIEVARKIIEAIEFAFHSPSSLSKQPEVEK